MTLLKAVEALRGAFCFLTSVELKTKGVGQGVDLPQVYFQTPTNKREPKPQQNQNEERRRGREIDLLGSLSHEY